ncbi:hypothetical protein ABZ897_55350 [Nonomuraea sp. NPDC046802]|uniref:hypothetical protein n=1 Tax=Nonomuraea sp. NPDC046802 TaxID=3154919 RepID=UPI0033D7CF8A
MITIDGAMLQYVPTWWLPAKKFAATAIFNPNDPKLHMTPSQSNDAAHIEQPLYCDRPLGG